MTNLLLKQKERSVIIPLSFPFASKVESDWNVAKGLILDPRNVRKRRYEIPYLMTDELGMQVEIVLTKRNIGWLTVLLEAAIADLLPARLPSAPIQFESVGAD